MSRQVYRRIIRLILEASELARSVGISNLLQPGLAKEMIIADILGHELIHSKRDADAHAPGNPDEKYEYLSCLEGGSGQLDRMYSEPLDKREQSLTRITRNSKFYFAVFYQNNQIKCKTIYEIETDTVLEEAERKLDRSTSSHIGFGMRWVRQHGKVVYEDDGA